MDEPGNVLKSGSRLFRIVDHLAAEGATTVTRLADDFDMPKSTAQMYLNTLYAHDYVIKTDGEYRLGLRFLKYGTQVRRENPLYPIVRSKVDELAASTGELAACFVEEGGEAVYLYGAEGEQSIRTDLSIGDRSGLHCTASGKAIVAHLPEERIHEIIRERGLEAKTERTITDPQEFFAELERIRERGYACARQESVPGVRVVAAPVLLDDRVLGSISLAGPASRFVGERFEEEIPALVRGTANEIELNLTYSESGI